MPSFAETRVRHRFAGVGAETGIAKTTVSSGQCSVLIGDSTFSVMVARDLTVAVGDVLLVIRQGSARWAVGRMFTAAPPPPPTTGDEIPDPGPPPKPITVSGQLICVPTYTGSFRDGKWRTDDLDVFQGQLAKSSFGINTGAAFYGTKPSSLKAGTVVTKATIQVRRLSGGVFGDQTATLWKVTQASKPVGSPTLTSSTTGPSMPINSTDTFVIPDSWGQGLVDGSFGGLAVFASDGSPYMQFAGKASWSPAWTLTINWTRTT